MHVVHRYLRARAREVGSIWKRSQEGCAYVPESLAGEESIENLAVLDVDFSGKEDPSGVT